jgi:uncharacterized membrane protein
MGRITIDMTINAPVETVFAYVDDYRNTTKYMKDLVKWRPTGKVTHGKGAQFNVGMKAGPTTLTSVVDITTWTENRAIGWNSNTGFKQIGLWAFKPKGEKTQVTFDMEYEFGGGIAGRLLGRAAEPIVRGNLQRSVETLKLHTEKLNTPKPAPRPAAKASTKPATKPAVPAARATTKSATKPAAQTRSKAKNSSKSA